MKEVRLLENVLYVCVEGPAFSSQLSSLKLAGIPQTLQNDFM